MKFAEGWAVKIYVVNVSNEQENDLWGGVCSFFVKRWKSRTRYIASSELTRITLVPLVQKNGCNSNFDQISLSWEGCYPETSTINSTNFLNKTKTIPRNPLTFLHLITITTVQMCCVQAGFLRKAPGGNRVVRKHSVPSWEEAQDSPRLTAF